MNLTHNAAHGWCLLQPRTAALQWPCTTCLSVLSTTKKDAAILNDASTVDYADVTGPMASQPRRCRASAHDAAL